jgi:hypothetical protein
MYFIYQLFKSPLATFKMTVAIMDENDVERKQDRIEKQGNRELRESDDFTARTLPLEANIASN